MRTLLRRLFRETLWTVGLAEVGEAHLVEILLGQRDLSDVAFRWLSRRGHSFVADPFVFRDGDALLLAFEDFRATTGRGVVSVRALDAELTPARVVRQIEQPHHLAFPSPVVLDGRVHLVPDSARKTLVAYPLDGGAPVRLDGPERLPCTDPALVEVQGGLVVLASDPDGRLQSYAVVTTEGRPTLGERIPVPGAGRLAGGVVSVGGRHFRLQQNSRDGYGTATDVFEIDPAAGDFAGVHRTTLTPPAGDGRRERWDGTHHLSYADGVLALDVRRRRFSVLATPLKVWYRLRAGG